MKISQREANKLRKRVAVLEKILDDQKRSWSSEWPGGVNIDTLNVTDTEWYIVATARKLGHAVILTCAEPQKLLVYAVKP